MLPVGSRTRIRRTRIGVVGRPWRPAVPKSLGAGFQRDRGVGLAGGQELPDHRPGVEGDAGTPGDLAGLQGGEHPERRVAHVEQQQATRLKGGEMLEQELALVPVIGNDEGVQIALSGS